MKKPVILLAGILFLAATCFGQNFMYLNQKERFNSEVISKFKATKTVFFIKENWPGVEQLKVAVKAAWTITPLIFDDIRNFEKYAVDPGYSYFVIEGLRSTGQSSSATSFFITLRLFDKVGKKNLINTKPLANIELSPNYQTISMSFGGEMDEVVNKVYEKAVFYNWHPVLLQANLKTIENNLKNNFRPALDDELKIKDLSQILSQDTLYVPKRLLMSFNPFNGKEEPHEENVFQDYRYKYRICTDAELYDIFHVQKRGRLVFEYIKSVSSKMITIFDAKEGQAIYKNVVRISYNLKGKDIERIR